MPLTFICDRSHGRDDGSAELARGAPRGLRRRGRGVPLAAWSACLAFAAAPVAASAQAECAEGRISSIFVDNQSVFDVSDPDLSPRFGWAYRTANRLHARTDEQVIRTELLFEVGDCYDLERLRDSERLLRGLEFIADVDIFGIRQPDGTIHVVVATQDEWSTRVEPRLGSGGVAGLRGLRLREDNVLGSGQHVSAFFLRDEEEQAYGAAYHTPQLFASRWDGHLEVAKTPTGYTLAESVRHPFVGEVGRWAATQAVRWQDYYFEYHLPHEGVLVPAWYPERRQSLELGGAYRWGGRGYNRTLLGLALAGERISYPEGARFGDRELNASGAVPPELSRDSISSVRAVVMTGQRNVYYVRRDALDTVNGTEDVRLGVEADVSIGPSLPMISRDRDLALDLSLFAASEVLPAVLSGLDIVLEARRNYDTPATESEWSDVFGRLDAWTYWRPRPGSRQTVVLALAAAGGWHDRVPFQLTLGSRTGLRGHADHAFAGGRRIVASVEHRSYLGWPLPDLFDLGAVVFADAGRIWAGDSEFGADSPVRADVGVGLRAAFPPGSRQTFRLDVGVPLGRGLGVRDVRATIGVGQLIGRRVTDRENQLRRSTRLGPTSSLFQPAAQP